MNSTCPQCGSRISEVEGDCLACQLLGALDDPEKEGDAGAGRQIAGYELVKLIGVGGTAEVYLARQTEPIERDVALKLIRHGMGSERVEARFDAEREVLAKLRHPYIAKIFDAGQTGAGLPYFVMEYVEGVPVTEFAAREALSLERRLQLFVQICEAVTHAHQRGVVHRDLKPSNVLVDTAGQPKVIDFGIARALEGGEFGDHTLFLTQEGDMLGTPAYMSPEQALGQLAEIDTRSDVFSLGVILYELLTGQLPVDIDKLRDASPLELRRLLAETDFQRPSLREATTRIPVGAIRGDLDWIVMKALERDKERRFGSVAALAEDVGRHLADEPVTAGPPTVRYRLQKFVRRNRAVVLGSSIAVAALLAGTGFSVTQAVRAKTAEEAAISEAKRAMEAQEEAVTQAQAAQTAREISEAINQFFIEDLLGADLQSTVRPDVTLGELVDTASRKTDERFRDQPEVACAVEMALGDLYHALGEFDKSEASYMRSRGYNESLADPIDRAKQEMLLLRRLAVNSNRQARSSKVAKYWEEWGTVAKRIGLQPEQLLAAKADRLAMFYDEGSAMFYDEGSATEAIEEMHALLPELEKHFGADAPATLSLKVNLGKFLVLVKDGEAGVPLIEEYVEKSRGAGKTLALAEALSGLGLEYARQGRLDDSAEAFEEAIAIEDEILPPDHRNRILTRLRLAGSYKETGRIQLSESTYREVFEIGMLSGEVLPIESLVAGLHYGISIIRKTPEVAKPVFERVLQGLEELGTKDGTVWSQTSFQLAISDWIMGQKDETILRINDIVARGIELGGESNPEVQELRKVLMQLELERGRPKAALPYAQAALAAPRPTDLHLRKAATGAIEAVLGGVEIAYADQPDLVIEMFRKALANGFNGDEVWRGLGVALYGRYSKNKDLGDLRLAAICLLKAVRVSDATGVKIITEWIDKDELAAGMQPPKFLVDPQTEWRYQEATPRDSTWRLGGFDAGGWPAGRGEFGYGDGDEDTLIGFGDDPGNKPMSASFRLELTVGKTYESPLVGTIAFDNGAIVYFNGQEVYRALLPQGDPGPDTPATGTEVTESLPHGFAIAPELINSGEPVVIAVQVHQMPTDADDLSFAFSMAEPMPKFEDVLDRLPAEELEEFFGETLGSLTGK